MHPAPLTPQSPRAATRLAGGLDALLWWPMERQPHPEVTGFNETGEGVFRPRFSAKGYCLPVDDFDRANREIDCPVRPNDRVGFREEWRVLGNNGIAYLSDAAISLWPKNEHIAWFNEDFAKRQLEGLDPFAWQSPATQPLWSIRRFGVVASVDVGRPVDASEEECELSGVKLPWDDEHGIGAFLRESPENPLAYARDELALSVTPMYQEDQSKLWWWKVRLNPMEDK